MKYFLASVLLIFGLLFTANAQTKTFEWETGLCSFKGTYDSSKYSEVQLKDTNKLLMSVGAASLSYNATPGNFALLEKLDVASLEKEYREKSAELRGLDLVKSSYWEKIRQAKIKELDQFYGLSKATTLGYKDPERIRDFEQAACCLNFYAQPLIDGGEYLLTTWRKVNMDSRTRNASPERLKRVFETQFASAEKFDYARLEVMTFGWWNCANETIERIESGDETYEKFDELFINVERECEEP